MTHGLSRLYQGRSAYSDRPCAAVDIPEGLDLEHTAEVVLELLRLHTCDCGLVGSTMWWSTPPSPGARQVANAVSAELTVVASRSRPIIKPETLLPTAAVRQWQLDLGDWRRLQPLVEAAELLDIPVTKSWPGLVATLALGDGVHRRRVFGSVHDCDSAASLMNAWDKLQARALVAHVGAAIPDGRAVSSLAEATAFGLPLVLKQRHSADGVGVIGPLTTAEQLDRAWAFLAPAELLVERALGGRTYRILLVDGEVLRISRGIPAVVFGDGRSTVRALVRSHSRIAWWLRDERQLARMRNALLSQGLDLTDVPDGGTRVSISPPTAEWEHLPVASLAPENFEMLRALGRYLAPSIVGVDVVCRALGERWDNRRDGIVDVNVGGGSWFHDGQPELATLFLDRLGLLDGPTRIPITCFAGPSAHKAARRAAAEAGGVQRSTDPAVVLDDRITEHAIVAVDDASLLAVGIPFDRCDDVVLLPGASRALADALVAAVPLA